MLLDKLKSTKNASLIDILMHDNFNFDSKHIDNLILKIDSTTKEELKELIILLKIRI